jgi:pilus assembly protein CpaF
MFGKKTSSDTSLVPFQESSPGTNLRSVTLKTKRVFSDTTQAEPTVSAGFEPKIEAIFTDAKLSTKEFHQAKQMLTEAMLERVDFSLFEGLSDDVKKSRVFETAAKIIRDEITVPLTGPQVELLKEQAIDDLLGFGPIEVLMADPDVSDIMVNGCKRVFIEKHGKAMLTDVVFTSEKHLLNVVQKIVSLVGRRVDESSPMVDARMPDGSRFNAIIPPLALNGSLVSIRKFRRQKMALRDYLKFGSMSLEMAKFLEICGHIRLNIIISGGTGSGKTTLLNALSGYIEASERIITVEDAAELQLQQPHVLRLETRPPNMEGNGEVNQRQLVRNALRMRPDRIIVGEIRGDEVIDVLSAMNTGHDGSMATIHANNPRDALSRIENLVGMSKVNIGAASLRNQISSAVNLIVQVSRQRDGRRRITQIEEIVGLDGENFVTQTLFIFRPGAMGADGVLTGQFVCTGAIPTFITQAAYFGRDEEMRACLTPTGSPSTGETV